MGFTVVRKTFFAFQCFSTENCAYIHAPRVHWVQKLVKWLGTKLPHVARKCKSSKDRDDSCKQNYPIWRESFTSWAFIFQRIHVQRILNSPKSIPRSEILLFHLSIQKSLRGGLDFGNFKEQM